MPDKIIRRQLQQLHDAIADADHVDEKGQALLRDIDAHIRDLLAHSETAAASAKPGLTRGLEDAIRHFEVTHPALTAAFSDLLVALSNAGI
jgi:hypothetical protein